MLARLDDGSFLSRIGALTVRIITADITVTCADGTRYTASYRLVTTLVDPRRHPAAALIALYHERWEHGDRLPGAAPHAAAGPGARDRPTPTACGAGCGPCSPSIKRCASPWWTRSKPSPATDPDRASFATALETAKDLLVRAENVITANDDLVGRIGRAILDDLHPCPDGPAPQRIRKVKSPLSRYNKKDPYRPERSNTDHRRGRHHQRPRTERHDTPIEMLDHGPRALTTRHWP